MNNNLEIALSHPLNKQHVIGDNYFMDGKPEPWKISYYPIFTDNKTKEVYDEPRALVEKPIQGGTDFREVPFRYLTKVIKTKYHNFSISSTIKITERKLSESDLKVFPNNVNGTLYIEEKIFNITQK